MEQTERAGVALAGGATGSSFLLGLLARAQSAFAEEFASVELEGAAGTFRSRFADLLPRFELARVVTPRRAEIARAYCLDAVNGLSFSDARGERPLADAIREHSDPFPLVGLELHGAGRFHPSVEFGGRTFEDRDLAELAGELAAAHYVTQAAAQVLVQLGERAHAANGLSLAGERFVLLGAFAELSPVYALLEAGAEVLWLDLVKPPVDHLLEPRLAGRLHYVEGGVDLLREPARVRATIESYADGRPVHLANYTYAPGGARELALAITFVALVQALDPASVGSVLLLLSPTSASPIAEEDVAISEQRAAAASTVERALRVTGPLSRAYVREGEQRISCAVVSQQGASYQVAEYVGRRMFAEALGSFGSTLHGRPIAVSSPMLPITNTRSLASPLLEAAVLGAPGRNMLIASARTARGMGALFTMHDVLTREARLAELASLGPIERGDALFARQFHGGVHAQPFALEGLIRVAALRGITQRPKLALELLR